ncbi:MAG: hypothetical protein QW607_10200 [Desulfurococcaceae archaeon]
MFKNTAYFFLLIMIVLIQLPLLKTAYREELFIPVKGNLYVLDMNITVRSMNDYGVFGFYLKPTGGYSYGFIVMKDPDEDKARVYLMAGNQSQWFEIGYLNESTITFRLFIDYNTSKAIYIFNNISRVFELDFLPRIEYFYLTSFNIQGRAFDYPELFINYFNIFVLNKSIEEINVNAIDIEKELGVKPVTGARLVSIPSQTLQTETMENVYTFPLYSLIIVLIIIVSAAIIISTIFIIKRKSPGP